MWTGAWHCSRWVFTLGSLLRNVAFRRVPLGRGRVRLDVIGMRFSGERGRVVARAREMRSGRVDIAVCAMVASWIHQMTLA